MAKKSMQTPDILPGEPGWDALQRKKKKMKESIHIQKKGIKKVEQQVGKIVPGDVGFRIGRPKSNYKGEMKYPIWRYKRRIGEIIQKDDEISLEFLRLGSVASHKHLIQDADFQLEWMTREQELLMTQTNCYICKRKLSKTAKPNLYHYKLFKKRTALLEEAAKIPEKVVKGKLTISQGWEKFNDYLEEGNRYYMSLKDTALICATCAKQKSLND